MGHNLNKHEASGEYAFLNANTKDKAWHQLGQQLEGRPATAKEAIEMAHLDYTVAKAPLTMQGADGSLVEVPDQFATYRTDTNVPFGVVGNRYQIVQNAEVFKFFDAIVGEGEAIYETAGALGNGEQIFISAKMPDYIRVGEEALEKYVMLLAAHNGRQAIKAMFTPVRPVCNNTVLAALNNCTNSVSIHHTTNALQQLKEAHKIMGMSNKLTEELAGCLGQMQKVRITDKKLLKYINQLFPNTAVQDKGKAERISKRLLKVREEVLEYTHTGPGQDAYEGTLYQAYNGVTGYFQNVREYADQEMKMKNIFLNGTAGDVMKNALKLATAWSN